MSMQLESFPCIIRSYQPLPKQLTAHAHGRAIGEDGIAYIVKGKGLNDPACVNEWICTSLAQALHLPVAPAKVLQMPNGDLVFGSGEMSHRLTDLEVGDLLATGNKPNNLFIPDFPGLLSRLYAFDLFVGNYDRHLQNYLISLELSDDRSTRTANIRAIDFDTADIVTRDTLQLPMHPKSNTVATGRTVRKSFRFDNQSVSDMLTRLKKGREFMFEQAMYGMPEQWLPNSQRIRLLDRVAGSSFEQQITHLEQGLINGTYL